VVGQGMKLSRAASTSVDLRQVARIALIQMMADRNIDEFGLLQ